MKIFNKLFYAMMIWLVGVGCGYAWFYIALM